MDLKANCEQRQKTAQESAKPFCTYVDKTASKLLLCIHGNGQNASIILRTIVLSELDVEVLLLQSPCIPYFNENAEGIVKVCRKKEIRVGIFCGELDEMCHDMAAGLYHRLIEAGVTASLVWQPRLRHMFPDKGTEMPYLEFL